MGERTENYRYLHRMLTEAESMVGSGAIVAVMPPSGSGSQGSLNLGFETVESHQLPFVFHALLTRVPLCVSVECRACALLRVMRRLLEGAGCMINIVHDGPIPERPDGPTN